MSYLFVITVYILPFLLIKPENRVILFKIYALAFVAIIIGGMAMFWSVVFGGAEYKERFKEAFTLPMSFWIIDYVKHTDSNFMILSLIASLFYTVPIDILLCLIIVNLKAPSIVLYAIQIFGFLLMSAKYAEFSSQNSS